MLPGSKAAHSPFVHSILRRHFHAEQERENLKLRYFPKEQHIVTDPYPFNVPLPGPAPLDLIKCQ